MRLRICFTKKAAKRQLSLKIFDYGEVEAAGGNRVRQIATYKKKASTKIPLKW